MIARFANPVFCGMVIIPNQASIVVGVGCHESIEMVEALAAGPMEERATLRSLGQGSVVPFAERNGLKAGVLKILGYRLRALWRDTVVARKAHRGECMRSQADAMRISRGHQRGPRGRT